MKNNNINKEIKEMFLREYFTFDLLLDNSIDRLYLYNLISSYMNLSNNNYYELLNSDTITSITQGSDYNRIQRLIEYYNIMNMEHDFSNELIDIINIKGSVIEELNKYEFNIKKGHNYINKLIDLCNMNSTLAMHIVGVMYLNGLYFNKDTYKGINYLNKTTNWTLVNSYFALLNYYCNLDNKEEASINNLELIGGSLLRNTIYESNINIINNKYHINIDIKKDYFAIKLVRKLLSSKKIDDKVYDKAISRIIFSDILSNKDKERILYSESKGLISLACELPLQLKLDTNNDINIKPLFNQTYLEDKLNRSLKKTRLYNKDYYKPIGIISKDNYLLDKYCELFKSTLNDYNVKVIDCELLDYNEVDDAINNIFIRSLNDDYNNAILLNLKGAIDPKVLASIARFINTKERRSTNISTLGLSIDLSNVLVVLFLDKRNSELFKDYIDPIIINELDKEYKDLEIDNIINNKKDEYMIGSVLLDSDVRNELLNKKLDDIYYLIDNILRNSFGEEQVIINLDLYKDYNTNSKNIYGFGGSIK